MSKLKKIYAEVPEVNCKGLCHETCGVIPTSRIENRIISERVGYNFINRQVELIEEKGCLTCPALVDNRCSIYKDRPLICRLYGAVKALRCPHGCTPKAFLPERKSRKLIMKVQELK
jgi:Fe-S-cluster containining protein